MSTALFTNFTDQEFTGYWDGKPRKFKPGESLYMPEYLAKHYAKHLVNRELLRVNSRGDLIHPGGDKMTSPKFPEHVPLFMELFNKAFTPEHQSEDGQTEEINTEITVENKNRQGDPQIILPPDDDEEEFEGKPEVKQIKSKK